MFEWVQNTPLINHKLSFSSFSKINAFLEIAIFRFDFSLKEPLTLLTMLVKTIHFKTENDIGNIVTDTVKRAYRNFNSFNFQQFSIFISDNIKYLQVLVVQRRLCQLQLNSPVMAALYIYKLQINANCKKRRLRGETFQSTMYLP